LGLRDVELKTADRLRQAGHTVATPDLFDGSTAASIDDGAKIVQRVGWPTVVAAAERELKELPPETVLTGFSMGVGVASELWSKRPLSAGAIFLHGLPSIPANVRRSFPVQVHVGEKDSMFADPEAISRLDAQARAVGARMQVYRYPQATHFFTDETLSDFNGPAASLTLERVVAFLANFME
jgi:dienelactone hydrolase